MANTRDRVVFVLGIVLFSSVVQLEALSLNQCSGCQSQCSASAKDLWEKTRCRFTCFGSCFRIINWGGRGRYEGAQLGNRHAEAKAPAPMTTDLSELAPSKPPSRPYSRKINP